MPELAGGRSCVRVGVDASRAGRSPACLTLSSRAQYLSKKYLKKQVLRDYLHVVATGKNAYELRYFKINSNDNAADADE